MMFGLLAAPTRWGLLVPHPRQVFHFAIDHGRYLLENWWATFSVSTAAAGLALLSALLLSALATRFRLFDIAFAPVVAASQSFPLQAIAPLLIIALGIGFHTKLAIAFIIAFFPMYGACATALKETPPPLLAYLAVCHTSFRRGMWYVRIPAALPAIVSSAKVGFTLAVLGAVVAEFIQPDVGLGSLLVVGQSDYDVTLIYTCILLLMFQGLFIYGIAWALEIRLLRSRVAQ
jgi:ABC-type nitrate/sulfonate/bicarbonate transport system permease component